MKHLRLVISLAALSACALRAQEGRGGPPEEIPDFSNLDEYIYVPKSTLRIGTRFVSGPKSTFSGKGIILSGEDNGSATGVAPRAYHDGNVNLDSRTTTVDNGDGTTSEVPVPPDGKTNSWNYSDNKQVADGLMTFHTYSAEITDSADRAKSLSGTVGTEILVAYDMGKIGKRFEWSLIAGVSLNDLSANLSDRVQADITSINDTYNLFGEIPPEAPYSAPSNGSTTVTNSDGTTSTVATDNTTLLGNVPLDRTATTTSDNTSVSNRWKLKGAYLTMRGGPEISLPIATKFHASFSAGPALIYAGTTYSVTQAFQPATGLEITSLLSDGTSRLLPGYYADVSLQYDLTERTGLYFGAVYQANGSYEQTVANGLAKYTTEVDLSSLNGFRAGMTYRF